MLSHRKLSSMLSSLIVIFSLTLSGFQPVYASAKNEDRVNLTDPESGRGLSARPESIRQNQVITPTATPSPTDTPDPNGRRLPRNSPISRIDWKNGDVLLAMQRGDSP